MVKAADAAVDHGYDVRLVSVDYIDWAAALDRDLVRRRQWRWTPISLRRSEHPVASRWVSARQRVARTITAQLDAARAPIGSVVTAYGRTHAELLEAILDEPFDFVYGGTVGALAAIAQAARRAGKPFALDFEDFHPAESEEPDADLTHALAARVVRTAADGASFTTAASGPMAEAYAAQFATRPIVILNVVPKPAAMPPMTAASRPLRLYWFSQVIGPKRGLEDIVRGVAAARVPAQLHLRGAARPWYVEDLRELAHREGADLEIAVHSPANPDAMVDLCAPFDIGLSPEQEGVLNRALCLPNKPLTYLAAGLAVIATDTPGQRTLRDEAGEAIWWYRPNDVAGVAEGLSRWHADRQLLARARQRSFRAAQEHFHWEHAQQRGALLRAFETAMA
jgi:glycosyltransferase involved in cell wall biosynthesis